MSVGWPSAKFARAFVGAAPQDYPQHGRFVRPVSMHLLV